MAELNLVPNPAVVVVQAAFFISNVVVAKKFFVEPYLKLKDTRDALTTKTLASARAMSLEVDQKSKEIDQRIGGAIREAQAHRERLHQEATGKRTEIMKKAEAAAKASFESITLEIRKEVEAQKIQVPVIVDKLANDVFALATT